MWSKIVIASIVVGCATLAIQDQDDNDRQLREITSLMDDAGDAFKQGDFDASAKRVTAAQRRLQSLVEGADAKLLEQVAKDYKRIQKAHELLTAKGIELNELKPLPDPVAPQAMDEDATEVTGVSFSKQVQPILKESCGSCHIDKAQGRISLGTYDQISKASARAGKVLVGGKPDQSRLFLSVEEGRMPKGNGKVSKKDLETIRLWIEEGAKDDSASKATKKKFR